MSCPRTLTPLLRPSRPSAPSSSSTGAQLASSAVSTTSHPLSYQEVILPVCSALYAWFPTPLPSPRRCLVSTTSSILCTPSVLSSTGTWVRVWRKVNSPRLVRILPPWRRTTKRSVPKLPKEKARRKTSERDRLFASLSTKIWRPYLLTFFILNQ